MKDIPQHRAFLVSLFCETLLYGVATILFILSIKTHFKKKATKGKLNLPLLSGALLLFFFATVHIAGVLRRTIDAFTSYPQGPEAYFALLTTPVKVVVQAGQIGAIIVGDALAVYRAFAVWNRNPRVLVVSALTLIATIVCAIAFIVVQNMENAHTSVFPKTVTLWTICFLATSLCTSGLSTLLIIFKLWTVQRQLMKTGMYIATHRLSTRVIRVFVESAALYSASNLVYMILYSCKLNSQEIVSGMNVPIASITFSLITLRIERVMNAPLTLANYSQPTFTVSKVHTFHPPIPRTLALSEEVSRSREGLIPEPKPNHRC